MPSFQDSAVIFFLALLLFGPKKLPELARQLGKLMGEFRRASNEFRVQMEDELRVSEQEERQKQIAAIETAAPAAAASGTGTSLPSSTMETAEIGLTNSILPPSLETSAAVQAVSPEAADRPMAPLPIATAGDLSLMPPSTGLPVARSRAGSSNLAPAFAAIPHAQSGEDSIPPPPDRYNHLAPAVDQTQALAPIETNHHA